MQSTTACATASRQDSASSHLPKASVVIPARNEAEHVGSVLAALASQTVKPAEIVFVDSGSTDNTASIARRHRARIFTLKPGEFSYGGALNFGVHNAEAPITVFLSAHAIPASPQWLEALLAPFHDPKVAAVFGRQLPYAYTNPLEALEIRRAYGARPRRYRKDPPFCSANAAVRRSLALLHPFREDVAYGEDLLWAREICREGHVVAYAPRAAVFHAHHETFREVLLRQRRETRERVLHLDFDTWLAEWWMVPVGLAWGVGRDWFRLAVRGARLRWFFRAPAFRLAKVLGTWRGFRDADKAMR
ncbi:MAG: glycosyltransferase family 2 protein [Planctomycetes bacterium]|nr:glycosyltransferase family 2 protein [Planctomycetota bacterium]